jgi:hypothetical protein
VHVGDGHVRISLRRMHGTRPDIQKSHYSACALIFSCSPMSLTPISKFQGVKPLSFDKVENQEIRDIIEKCIRLKREER